MFFASKYVGTRGPEARLFAAMAATVLFPAGMFIYAWSTYTKVYWISLAIGMVVRVSFLQALSDSEANF